MGTPFKPLSATSPSRHTLMLVVLCFLLPVALHGQYRVEHLSKPLNTAGSETAALQVGDTVLVYASLPPNSGTGAFGLKREVTHLYQARIAKSGKLSRPKHDRWGFCSHKEHTGNLALDPLSRDAYFTRADIESLRCDIWWAPAKKRRGWEKPRPLRGAVNNNHSTATHPTLGRLPDGTTILYFVSDREGGMGGMDIWYSIITDGIAGEPVNLGPQVNTAADEITPFYDQPNGILYFSSNREGGRGGYDIYCAVGQRNTWQHAEPVCGCLNSEQNDIYFTVTRHDPATNFPIGGHLSSNRKDSYFLNDSMCCYDIYRWELDSTQWIVAEEPPVDTTPSYLSLLSSFRFPLSLYFHNDDPDPMSRDSTTSADYADCQLRYALLRSTYLAHQPAAPDSAAMQRFFDSCVVGNFDRALLLLDAIEEALADGRSVQLTVSGHASPVFTDAYNHILSQRRIESLINMIRARKGGLLAHALDDGRLIVKRQPLGAGQRSTLDAQRSTSKDPVYGLPAALARRIVIVSCEVK